MADHKVIDGKVYVGETGTVAWAGDPGEVAQMLDRICELEAERDEARAWMKTIAIAANANAADAAQYRNERDEARRWARAWKASAKDMREDRSLLRTHYAKLYVLSETHRRQRDEAQQRVKDLEQVIDGKNGVIVHVAERAEAVARAFRAQATNYRDQRRRCEELEAEKQRLKRASQFDRRGAQEARNFYQEMKRQRDQARRYAIAYRAKCRQLQAAADQAISDLRVVATLAIGCEEENTILSIIDEVAARFAAIMESETKEETSS